MHKALICVAASLFIGVVGCKEEPETPVTPAVKSTEQQVQDATKSVTGQMEKKSGEMQQEAEKAHAKATAGAEQKVAETKVAANEAGTATADKAQELLDKAVEYAKDNKFDLAEKAVDQAAAMPNLPETVKTNIPKVREMIKGMKTSGAAGDAAKNMGKAVDGMGK